MRTDNLAIGSRVDHADHGEGVVVNVNVHSYKIAFPETGLIKTIDKDDENLTLIERLSDEGSTLSLTEVKEALGQVLREYVPPLANIQMANKYDGGTVILSPADSNLQSKEVPINTFFHKIVMVRDRLRVLEQNINSHKKLDDQDKVHLQQYITRAYGSLTTFNVLFAEKEDQFRGSKS